MAIFAPILVPIVAPGFDAPTTELTIRMTRVMLISPVLIGMGAVVTGILNSYQQFTVPAIAPLLYNVAIIGAAIFLAPIMGVEGLAVGVAIGSLAHLAVQLPNLARVGQRYDLTIGLSHPGVRRVAWLMGPRTLGTGGGADQLPGQHRPRLGTAGGQPDRVQLRLPAVADPGRGHRREHRGGPVPDAQRGCGAGTHRRDPAPGGGCRARARLRGRAADGGR